MKKAASFTLTILTGLFWLSSFSVGEEVKPYLPAGAKGFSGKISGKIISKTQYGFVLQVSKIEKLWKKNKAQNPGVLVGKKVLINVQWEKGKDGKWHPREAHMRFIRAQKVGEEICVEVINDEGHRLHILEVHKKYRK